jgi:hypothetical protein
MWSAGNKKDAKVIFYKLRNGVIPWIHRYKNVGFEIPMVVTMNIMVPWVVMPCSSHATDGVCVCVVCSIKHSSDTGRYTTGVKYKITNVQIDFRNLAKCQNFDKL